MLLQIPLSKIEANFNLEIKEPPHSNVGLSSYWYKMEKLVIRVCSGIFYCITVFFGIPLLLGLVSYERNGQDPMKRNQMDMVRIV